MRPPPDPPHRKHIPGQSLLLTASLVTSWNSPSTAQLSMESVLFNAAEGKDVPQSCPQSAREYSSYVWNKGKRVGANLIAAYIIYTQVNTPGPAYSSQKTLFPNGSLLFQNVTRGDTEHYTLQIVDAKLSTDQASGQFHIHHKLDQPLDNRTLTLLSVTRNDTGPYECGTQNPVSARHSEPFIRNVL
ncbi:PREDICTED: carcinoembryonic antigen-related cell adhesion molecule 5-like, partial [Galeopterus variegatus]|uniref:Carcinoembryonic antigen-related cell adhesion molecule 5-like n=1 Tax=Galeopterus variegatus TaxID=482537 RepID=A0ABM0Q580_GALVR